MWRLSVLAYFAATGANADDETAIKDNKKYFLPRGITEKSNLLNDGRNFYDQPINDLIKQYDGVSKVLTGQSDYYTTRSLLNYAYFKDNYRPIAVNLSKQKPF